MPLNLSDAVRQVLLGKRPLTHEVLNEFWGGSSPDSNPFSVAAKLTPTTADDPNRGLSTTDFAEDLVFDAHLRLGNDGAGKVLDPDGAQGALLGWYDILTAGAVANGIADDRAVLQALEATLLETWAVTGDDGPSSDRAAVIWTPSIPGRTVRWGSGMPANTYGGLQYRSGGKIPWTRTGTNTVFAFRHKFRYTSGTYGTVTLPKVLHYRGQWYDGQLVHDRLFDFQTLVDGEVPDLVLIEDCYFANFCRTNGTGPIIQSAAKRIVIRNCVFRNPNGILWASDGNVIVENCLIYYDSNYREGVEPQTLFVTTQPDGNLTTLRNVTVVDPAGDADSFVFTVGANDALVTGCSIDRLRGSSIGIRVVGAARSIITDNRITAYSSGTAYTLSDGVEVVGSGAVRNIVAGNDIIASDRHGTKFTDGIDASVSGGGNVIEGNKIGPNVDTAVKSNYGTNPIDGGEQPDIIFTGLAKNFLAMTDFDVLVGAPLQQDNLEVEWEPIGPGFNDTVHDVEVFNGNLYACGDFTQSGSFYGRVSAGTLVDGCMRVAILRGRHWEPVGKGFDDTCYVLKAIPELGRLVAGGKFDGTPDGGTTFNRMAYITAKNSTWQGFPTGGTSFGVFPSSVNTQVRAIAGPYGAYYWVGGSFGQVVDNGHSIDLKNLVAFKADPTANVVDQFAFSEFFINDASTGQNTGPNAPVNVLYHDGGVLWVGGTWSSWDTSPATFGHPSFEGGGTGDTVACFSFAGYDKANHVLKYADQYNGSGNVIGFCNQESGNQAPVFAINGHAGRLLIGGQFTGLRSSGGGGSTLRGYNHLVLRGREGDDPISISRINGSDGIPTPVKHIFKLAGPSDAIEGMRFLICAENALYVITWTGPGTQDHKIQQVNMPTPAGFDGSSPEYISKCLVWERAGKRKLVVVGQFIEGSNRNAVTAYGQSANLEVRGAVPYLVGK